MRCGAVRCGAVRCPVWLGACWVLMLTIMSMMMCWMVMMLLLSSSLVVVPVQTLCVMQTYTYKEALQCTGKNYTMQTVWNEIMNQLCA